MSYSFVPARDGHDGESQSLLSPSHTCAAPGNTPGRVSSQSVHNLKPSWSASGELSIEYRPPSFRPPPQMTMTESAQTATCPYRPLGALFSVVDVQLSVEGLYRPPVFLPGYPPQTIP